jgi:hypothetical protein
MSDVLGKYEYRTIAQERDEPSEAPRELSGWKIIYVDGTPTEGCFVVYRREITMREPTTADKETNAK